MDRTCWGMIAALGLNAAACGSADEQKAGGERPSPLKGSGLELTNDIIAPQDPKFLPPGVNAPESLEVGTTSQAIIKGTVVPDRNVSAYGVVAIWVFNSDFSEWREMCTGTLLRNDIIVTAKHCFTAPQVAGKPFAITYGPFNAAQAATPNGAVEDPSFDVIAVGLSVPFTINGSTTSWIRKLVIAEANRTALSIGYGFSVSGTVGDSSSICHTGTKGCWEDPRPQRSSFHVTNWQPNAVGRELWVGANSQNQFPTHGDSGQGLIDFYGAGTPVIGIYSANFNASPPSYPTNHADYVPVQDVEWLCVFANCS